MKKVVVIGGGTGTFVTISALKAIPGIDISAIVTVADSGGSTGRLRDEFGFQPVGDLRQALAALAAGESNTGNTSNTSSKQNWIREMLLYRFSRGNGLEGHNLGNLILTALQDMTGSTAKAIEVASKIFRLHGHIYPITTQNIQLVIEYADGTVEIGEHLLDNDGKHGGEKIVNVKISPRAAIYSKAKEAIEQADVVIVGPGDIYGSIVPNLVVDGVKMAVGRSRAKYIFILNLMTRYTQTHDMTAADHVGIVENYLGRKFDAVIANSAPIPQKILDVYRKQHEYPVVDDLTKKNLIRKIIRASLLTASPVVFQKGDRIKRSYLRHDAKKMVAVLERLVK